MSTDIDLRTYQPAPALLAGRVIGRDLRHAYTLQGRTFRALAAQQLRLKRNHLALIRTTSCRARRLRVRDILRDHIEPGFLRRQGAGAHINSGNKIHGSRRLSNDQDERPVMAIFNCLMLKVTTSVRYW